MWSKIIILCCLLARVANSFVHQGIGRSNVAAKNGLFAGNDDDEIYIEGDQDESSIARRDFVYNAVGAGLIAASGVASYSLFQTNVKTPSGIQRLPRTQFIAALGDPKASEGMIAEDGSWGLWPVDPGPRGVWLRDYKNDILQSETKYRAPAGWTFDPNNWWLEEHGLIMEAPDFPLREGKYLVTGGRMVTTTLTVEKGGKWKLDEGTLYDVTHLPCRSARYQPISGGDDGSGSPVTANPRDFPVTPGAIMPSVPGAKQQDYAVLFVVGKAV
jgi:hypothetical protein